MKIKVKDSDIRDFYQLQVGNIIENARYLSSDNYDMDEYLASEFGRDVPCNLMIMTPREDTSGKSIQIWIDNAWRVWTSPVESIRRYGDTLVIITKYSTYTFRLC